MPRNGRWPARGAAHRQARQAAWDQAGTAEERLTAATGWFRSSVKLLGRRRPPRGIPSSVHRAESARLTDLAAAHLKALAAAIDAGDYDAQPPGR
jgi:hypothetical protein